MFEPGGHIEGVERWSEGEGVRDQAACEGGVDLGSLSRTEYQAWFWLMKHWGYLIWIGGIWLGRGSLGLGGWKRGGGTSSAGERAGEGLKI